MTSIRIAIILFGIEFSCGSQAHVEMDVRKTDIAMYVKHRHVIQFWQHGLRRHCECSLKQKCICISMIAFCSSSNGSDLPVQRQLLRESLTQTIADLVTGMAVMGLPEVQ